MVSEVWKLNINLHTLYFWDIPSITALALGNYLWQILVRAYEGRQTVYERWRGSCSVAGISQKDSQTVYEDWTAKKKFPKAAREGWLKWILYISLVKRG